MAGVVATCSAARHTPQLVLQSLRASPSRKSTGVSVFSRADHVSRSPSSTALSESHRADMECVTDVLLCSAHSSVGAAVVQPVEMTLSEGHYSSLQTFWHHLCLIFFHLPAGSSQRPYLSSPPSDSQISSLPCLPQQSPSRDTSLGSPAHNTGSYTLSYTAAFPTRETRSSCLIWICRHHFHA